MFVLIIVLGTRTATGMSKAVRVNPEDPLVSGSIVVGEWVAATAAGPVRVTLEADGSMMMAFPEEPDGSFRAAFLGAGFGTWESAGADGVAYFVVRAMHHPSGVFLGRITIEAYLALSPDRTTSTDDGQPTVITVRDSTNQTRSVTGAATMVASRGDIDQVQAEDGRRSRGGRNTCR